MKQSNLRNLAIVAHVDHGKTTLLDKLLEQTGTFASHEEVDERMMDSNPLEKERGITILSKCTSLKYKDQRINIVDTPGHADFGGEVERILNMVDGVLLLVDAFEGPMPQTRFVTKKALELGLTLIVVLNKIDRPGARPDEVLDMVFDLFVDLNASEEQLDFKHIYASAKEGYSMLDHEQKGEDLRPMLDMIVDVMPSPDVEIDAPFQMLVTDIQYDNYLGRLLLGRVHRGSVKTGTSLSRINGDGKITQHKIGKLFMFQGLNRVEVTEAQAGDIILISGIPEGVIGDTLADTEAPEALAAIEIDPPTITMNFRINDSPFAGNDGKFVTSRHLRDRLYRELLSNVALKVEDTDSMDEFKVSGRGELHLSILIETMRREGYEFSVSRPQVIYKEIDGKKCEPIEELSLEIPETSMGPIMEELGKRKADIKQVDHVSDTTLRLSAHVPTRGLIAFRSTFLTMTKGEGIMNHTLLEYQPFKGETNTRANGVLIAMETGESIPYSIWKLQDRGYFIIPPNIDVYEGMIVGANSREQDMTINVCTKKKMTNVRASGKDDMIQISPHRKLGLEQALEFIEDDELVEVTPKNIRLRKRYLQENDRILHKKRLKAQKAD